MSRCVDLNIKMTSKIETKKVKYSKKEQNAEYTMCVEIKCQLDATEILIADSIACSTCFGHHYAHHQELKSIIQWLLRVVFCAVVFSSSWSEGYASGLQDAGKPASCKPDA